MTSETKLALLKANLEIIQNNTSKDDYLTALLTAAAQDLARQGITLDDSVGDGNLQVMWAAWLYRKRADGDPSVPRMLQIARNNRLMSEKVST